ncbi:hypothetical protein EJK15_69920, partial [Nonomuraea basaltis]
AGGRGGQVETDAQRGHPRRAGRHGHGGRPGAARSGGGCDNGQRDGLAARALAHGPGERAGVGRGAAHAHPLGPAVHAGGRPGGGGGDGGCAAGAHGDRAPGEPIRVDREIAHTHREHRRDRRRRDHRRCRCRCRCGG